MKIFIGDISEIKADNISILSIDRKNKISNYKNEIDKKLSILTGLLLLKALGDKSYQIKYSNNGKPYLDNGPYFSISHSGTKAVVVTSNFPIGVDIQLMKNPDYNLCEKYFSKEEQKITNSVDFYKAWTSKEAYCKACDMPLINALKVNIPMLNDFKIVESKVVDDNYYLSIVQNLKIK